MCISVFVSLTNCIMYYLFVLTMYICLLFLPACKSCTSPFVMGINSFIHSFIHSFIMLIYLRPHKHKYNNFVILVSSALSI